MAERRRPFGVQLIRDLMAHLSLPGRPPTGAGPARSTAAGRAARVRRVALPALAGLLCLAVAAVTILHASGSHRAARVTPPVRRTATATATRVLSAADQGSPRSLPTATPAPTAIPTATLPSFSGVSARPHLYPRVASPDLTIGGPPAPQPRAPNGRVFTPAESYAAQDTLTDTGPGPPGPLSGLPTRPDLARRRPVAVIIDNFDPDARPQAGLNRASLVFETVAEGGITRFMAVYLEKDAPVVGPVRSARIYFDAWAAGLHAIYGHAGGNNDALAELPHLTTMVDVDGLAALAPSPFSGDLYWRSGDRQAPHNFYTSTDLLRAYADATTHAEAGLVVPTLPHKEPAAWWVRPKGGWIHLKFSSASYSVQYRYDPRCNCYPRSMNGQPHVDEFSLRQIAPSNVVVLFAGMVPDPASDTPGSVSVQTRGLGRALYFRDGLMVQGLWRKSTVTGALSLLDLQGQPLALNPGQTWIEVLPTVSDAVIWQLH